MIKKTVFLVILFFSCPAFSQTSKLKFEDLQSQWYNTRYLEALENTKSTLKAVGGVYSVMFEISKDEDVGGYTLLLVFNFHEGLGYKLTNMESADDSTYILYGRGVDNRDVSYRFRLLHPDEMNFLFESKFENFKGNFKRIKNFERYVNELTVAGIYRDDQNRLYFFYKNGLALWSDDKFYYEVGLDHVLMPVDYIDVKNRKDENGWPFRYFFKAAETGLEISKAVYERGGFPVMKDPILKLSKFEKEFYAYIDDSRFQLLEAQSREQLRLLRNEIFARHRHSFESPDLRRYFANQPWYHEYEDHKVSIDELSEAELKVLKRIQHLEKNEK